MHGQHAQGEQAVKEHIDPVCGMTVEEGPDAITGVYKGVTYYFCGRGCKVSFEKEPEKYLREGPSMQM
jgi:YHS domain-containing protein